MPFFEYMAAESNGRLKRGQIEAVDRSRAIEYLKSQKLLVVSVKEKAAQKKLVFTKKLSYEDKINFSGNLSTMIKAGVSLLKGLEIIRNDSANNYFKSILGDLEFAIENGKPLSQALEAYPKDFDAIFINMIKAGEASGKLDESLRRLNLQLKKEAALVSKVKGALIYPAILIGGVLLVLIIIITFVIPKLVSVFSSSNLEIPWTTRALFFLARIASFKPILTIAVVVGLIILTVIVFSQKGLQRWLKKIIFRLPIASSLIQQLELQRFCRTAGGLLQSGVNIGETLSITASGMTLGDYQKIILKAREKILKGVSLGNAFRGQDKYFPTLLVSIINVGEKTGQLDNLLLSLANYYEEQADNSLKTLASLIEPALLVVVGLLIGGMAVSIVVPIYQLIGTI